MPVVGFLSAVSAPVTNERIRSFDQGLKEIGFVVGTDVILDVRMAEGNYDRLPTMAADLVNRRVNLIAALAPSAVLAAKTVTTSIPIVFVVAFDPVKAGLVNSLNRPGGNVTGITFIGASLGAKRLELARGAYSQCESDCATHPSKQSRCMGRSAQSTGCRKQ